MDSFLGRFHQCLMIPEAGESDREIKHSDSCIFWVEDMRENKNKHSPPHPPIKKKGKEKKIKNQNTNLVVWKPVVNLWAVLKAALKTEIKDVFVCVCAWKKERLWKHNSIKKDLREDIIHYYVWREALYNINSRVPPIMMTTYNSNANTWLLVAHYEREDYEFIFFLTSIHLDLAAIHRLQSTITCFIMHLIRALNLILPMQKKTI